MRPPPVDDPGILRPWLLPTGAPLDWSELFGAGRPVEIEIGSGKGWWLLETASADPATGFLGIEIRPRLAHYVALRLGRRNLSNVRILHDDAREVLGRRVPPASVRAVHLYFPDPWWKSRHRRRRIGTPALGAAIERVLQPGGRLLAATDVPAVAEALESAILAGTGLVPTAPEAGPPGSPGNFERKAESAGRPVVRLGWTLPA